MQTEHFLRGGDFSSRKVYTNAYSAPSIELFEVKVEQGFANSLNDEWQKEEEPEF